MSKLTDEWGFFTPMPEMVIKMWKELGTNAVALFLYLRYRTNKNRGVAFPGYEKIREDTGWGYSRVKEAIEILEDAKLVKCKKRYGRTTEYTLTKPPNVAVLDQETASITESVGLEADSSISPTESVVSVLPKQEDVLKTESTQTELKDSRAKSTRTSNNRVRKALQEQFIHCTHLKAPRVQTQKERNAAGSAWWAPLREIAELTGWDVLHGQSLIGRTVQQMRADGLTISSPRSILNVARAIVAEGAESVSGTREFLDELRRT